MIKRFLLLLSLIGIVSLPAQVPSGRVIITLKTTRPMAVRPGQPRVAPSEQDRIVTRLRTAHGGMTVRRKLQQSSMIVADIQPGQIAEILADSNVAAVEQDRLWNLAETTDSPDLWEEYHKHSQTVPYGITQVTAPQVWATGNRGQGIKVGVMDTGGDPTHPDLVYTGGYNFAFASGGGGDSTTWQDNIASCNGHGTHVAGTIAAQDNGIGVVGVAPNVQLYALKVFQDISGACQAFTSTQIAALNWAVTHGIRVVNVSIGGSHSPAYDIAITQAAAAGTYMMAAAGNNGGALTWPGASPSAFAIGAVDGSNSRASWSDFGPELDFVAPGVNITSTLPGGGYGDKSGTSMATPHAVGVAALILSANPALTRDQLYQKMHDGALDIDPAGFDVYTGYGLLRAFNSITAGPPPPPLVMSASPSGQIVSVVIGSAAQNGSATVSFTGTNASTAPWIVTNLPPCSGFLCGPPIPQWAHLLADSVGVGSGTFHWTRITTGMSYGRYVNTFQVSSPGVIGSPITISDTLWINPSACSITTVGPTTRNYTVATNGMTVTDTIQVQMAGMCSWNATSSRTPLVIQGSLVIFTASATDTIRIIKQ